MHCKKLTHTVASDSPSYQMGNRRDTNLKPFYLFIYPSIYTSIFLIIYMHLPIYLSINTLEDLKSMGVMTEVKAWAQRITQMKHS